MITGIGWYDAAQYAQLRKQAADAGRLDTTFEAWERNATRVFESLRQQGVRVEKVAVDVEDLVRWCQAHGRPLDGSARAQFVAELAERLHRPGQGRRDT
jgi:hypothetical protein